MNGIAERKTYIMRKLFIFLFLLTIVKGYSQTTLPILELDGKTDKPFIVMISGDGGAKGFTVSLVRAIHDRGYAIALIDARSYFWQKKTPEETTAAISSYISGKLSAANDHRWAMVGYSFGADITPFVVNRLPDSLRSRLTASVLLSPSTSTDFEIHLSDMLGIGKKRSMDVIREINRMGDLHVSIIGGDDESGFPFSQIKLSHFHQELVKGDHHYGGDFRMVGEKVCEEIGE
ncbi:MAG: virulence factor family protein [Citrobacter freundii]|nr:MAG: virulence factor family protein [Citrobacter freundii]